MCGKSPKPRKKKDKDSEESKGTTIIFYVALFSFLIFPSALRRANPGSQSPLPAVAPTGVLKLTLEQAVTLGLKQNPTQQIAVLNALESVQDKNITRSELLPQASLKVQDSANRVNLEAQFGGNISANIPLPASHRAVSDFFCRPHLRQFGD